MVRAGAVPGSGGVLIRALGVAAISGALAGSAMAAVLVRLNEMSWLGDFPRLGAYLTGLYALLYAVPVLGAAGGALLLGRRPGTRALVAVAVGFTVLFNGVLRFKSVAQPLSVTPHLSWIGALDGVVILAATGLLAAAVVLSRRRGLLAAAAGVGLLLALAGIHRLEEEPLERDLSAAFAGLPPAAALPEAAAGSGSSAGSPLANARLVVLGLDGLSWEVLLPLLRQGELPAFRSLLDESAYGYLETLPIAISPVVWETISTGQPPERHGIGYHAHFEFPGLADRIRILPHMRLQSTLMGIRRLLSATTRWAPWSQVPADSTDARVARIWEIAARSGISVGVYDWMNTTPVAPIEGFVHGYYPVPPTLYPRDLLDGEPEMPVDVPSPVSGLGWVEAKSPREWAKFEQFLRLSGRYQPDAVFYYTHFGDAVNHVNWKQEALGDGPFISGLEHPEIVFDSAGPVAVVNRFLDRVLARVLAEIPPEAVLVIVSDHGFDFRGYEHDNCPSGVILMRGPGIAAGPIEDASVFDVSPTLLHLLGLSVAQDMDGGPLPVAEPGGPFDRRATSVGSYGAAAEPLASEDFEQDELKRHEDYLRSLGYVN